MKAQSKLAKGRFTGDPAYEFEHTEVKKIGEGDDATEEEETVSDIYKCLLHVSKNLNLQGLEGQGERTALLCLSGLIQFHVPDHLLPFQLQLQVMWLVRGL